MAAVQAAEKHGDVSDLTWYFLSEIYRSTWTHSQNSLAANMKTWQTWHDRLWLMFNIHIILFLALKKGENCQSYFSSGSHHLVKKSPSAKFLITLHLGHPPPPVPTTVPPTTTPYCYLENPGVLWLELFSFFLKILSVLAVGWGLRIL